MNRNNERHFNQIPEMKASRTRFNRDQTILTTFDSGKLIPFYVDEVLPGDTFNVDTSAIIRMTTPKYPVMDDAFIDFYYFYCPNRILWDNFKQFMGEVERTPWMPEKTYENLFDDFFDPFWNDAALERMMNREARDTFGKRGANMMKTDVKQTDNGYEVAVDLPGCKKEDVQMDLNDGYLTIQAVRSHSNDEKDKKGRYLRHESFSGTCARSFYVGDVKKEDIHAKFEDGVLHVELPAPQQTKALPENPNLIAIE